MCNFILLLLSITLLFLREEEKGVCGLRNLRSLTKDCTQAPAEKALSPNHQTTENSLHYVLKHSALSLNIL